MAEWFKAHAWKVCVLSKVPRVRIPVSPPLNFNNKIRKNLEYLKITFKFWINKNKETSFIICFIFYQIEKYHSAKKSKVLPQHSY